MRVGPGFFSSPGVSHRAAVANEVDHVEVDFFNVAQDETIRWQLGGVNNERTTGNFANGSVKPADDAGIVI